MERNFELLGRNFYVSEGRDNLTTIYKFIYNLASNIESDFNYEFKKQIKKIEEFEKAQNIALDLLSPIADEIAALLVRNKIFDISRTKIVSDILSKGVFQYGFNTVIDQTMEIEYQADEEKIARENGWSGVGLGSVLASGLAHSAGNLFTYINKNADLKSLFNESEEIKTLGTRLWIDVLFYYKNICKQLEEKAGIDFEYITDSDENEEESIINNLISISVPDDLRIEMLYNALKKNPFSSKSYIYIFNKYDDKEKKNIIKLAEYFGVNLNEEIDDYLRTIIENENISSIASAELCKDRIISKMNELDIEYSNALNEVEAKIYNHKLKKIYFDIDLYQQVSEIQDLIKNLDMEYFSENYSEIIDYSNEKINTLCTYFDIKFNSQQESERQKKMHEDFKKELNFADSSESVKSIRRKIEESDLHEKIKSDLNTLVMDSLYENEYKEYQKIISGNIYELSINDFEKVKSEVEKRDFCEKVSKIINHEINCAEQKIKAEKGINDYKNFYYQIGVIPGLVSQAAQLKSVNLVLKDCDKEVKEYVIPQIKEKYKVLLENHIESDVLKFKELCNRLGNQLGKPDELLKLVRFYDDNDFCKTKGIDEILNRIPIWETPVVSVLSGEEIGMIISTGGLFSTLHRFLFNDSYEIIAKNYLISRSLVIKDLKNDFFKSSFSIETSKKGAQSFVSALTSLITDLKESVKEIININTNEEFFAQFEKLNQNFGDIEINEKVLIDIIYYIKNECDFDETIVDNISSDIIKNLKEKISNSSDEYLEELKNHSALISQKYENSSIPEIDKIFNVFKTIDDDNAFNTTQNVSGYERSDNGFSILKTGNTETMTSIDRRKMCKDLFKKKYNTFCSNSYKIYTFDSVPSKVWDNVQKKIGKEVDTSLILGVLDTSILNNGKSGFVFLESGFCYFGWKEKISINYCDILSIDKKAFSDNENGDNPRLFKLIFEKKNGKTESINDAITYKDILIEYFNEMIKICAY